MKATIGSQVLASSNDTVVVEGNNYFPPTDVEQSLFRKSSTHSTCPWKGEAHYYDAVLPDGTTVKDVAWYYPEPKPAANNIKGYLAFYKNKVNLQK